MGEHYCSSCKQQFESNYRFTRHLSTKKHLRNENYCKLLKKSECKNVIVSPDSEDCVISSVSFTDEYPESISIDSPVYTDNSLTIEVHSYY